MQPDPDLLLSQSAGLRQLALCLLQCEQDVEDVLQDAWIRAKTRPPQRPGPLHGWLRTVVRNLALQRQRGEGRRRRREQQLDPGRVETPAELAARSEILAVLMHELNRLRPAYRDALVLRFLDGMPVAAIAERLGIPEATVHTRLRRGREALRQVLEAEWGVRECEGRLAAAALPAMGILKQALVGGALMGMGSKVGIAGLVVAAGAMLMLGAGLLGPERQKAVVASAPGPAGAAAEAATTAGAAPVPEESRVALSTVAVRPAVDAAAIPVGAALSGRFLLQGQPVEGIRLEVQPKGEGAVETVSDADGRFRLEGLPAGRKLELKIDEFFEFQPGIAGVEEGEWDAFRGWVPEACEGLEFLLLRRPTVSGRVLKPDGSPAAFAEVGITAVGLPPRTWTFGKPGKAGADGRFALPIPTGPGIARVRIGASLEGGESLDRVFRGAEIPADGDLGDLSLGETWKIRFRVVDHEGAPVTTADAQTETGRCPGVDADGRGVLTASPGDAWLWVEATGFLPGFLALEGYRGEELQVRLRRSTELEVRLLLDEGQAVSDFTVELMGPSRLLVSDGPSFLSSSWHGRRGRGSESKMSQDSLWRAHFRPDPEGVVLVNGLLPDSPMTLRVHGWIGVAFEQPIGAFHFEERKEFTVDLRGRGGTFQGRVVGPDGRGVPGAWIRLQEEDRSFSRSVIGDGEGRFAVHPAFAEVVEIRVHAEGFLPRTFSDLAGPPPGEDLVLTLERGRDVRFTVIDPEGLSLVLEDLDFRVIGHEWVSFERDSHAGSYRLADLPVHELQMEVVGAGGRWSFLLPAEVGRFEYRVEEIGAVRLPAVAVDPGEISSSWRLSRRDSLDPALDSWEAHLPAYQEVVVHLVPGEYHAELFQAARRDNRKSKSVGPGLRFRVVAGEELVLDWPEDGAEG
ncbi:MAG: sigma-70 family RNA polymerase sigma factor [Planctomycetes bacterium]|nr:sigma-70 family RNA polymerase sigma factor [Planctomycetota bacterium]